MLLTALPYAGITPVELAKVAQADSGSTAASYSFTGLNFGDALASRLLVCGVYYSIEGVTDTGELTALTIGGVSATRAVRAVNGLSVQNAEIWYANVPTGTSGDVAITLANNKDRCGVFLYRIIKYKSSTPNQTATDSAAVGETTLSTTIQVAAGAGVIAVAGKRLAASGAYSWTGLTEDYDVMIGTETPGSSASLVSRPAISSLAVDAVCSVAGAQQLAVASFR